MTLSSGKIFYDLQHSREERKDARKALLRLEQLYPFPSDALRDFFSAYPSLREIVWVQNEPQNMGAWTFVQPRLSAVLPANVRLRYAGRVPSASPATGNANVHKAELTSVLAAAFGGG